MENIIITEILTTSGIDRWYYGAYSSLARANEVALLMNDNNEDPEIYYSVITRNEAVEWGVNNLPF